MRIDLKHEAEAEKRQGMARKTLRQGLWLVVSFAAAYALSAWLFSSGKLPTEWITEETSLPEDLTVGLLRLVLAFVLVGIIQFIGLIAYAMTSPGARKRTGDPSAETDNPDFYERKFTQQ
jgi:hypothetical protein